MGEAGPALMTVISAYTALHFQTPYNLCSPICQSEAFNYAYICSRITRLDISTTSFMGIIFSGFV